MKSMTGYGFSELHEDDLHVSVEIKAYNNRFLDIVHNIPYFLAPFEQEIDAMVKDVSSRGRIEVTVRLRQSSEDLTLEVDKDAVARYADAFSAIAREAGTSFEPTLADFLEREGVLTATRDTDVEVWHPTLFAVLGKALEQFSRSKEREGEATRRDLERLGTRLTEGLETVETYAEEMERMIRASLTERFNEMLGEKGYDENRFLQEVAVMLVRYSINEEIVRLRTHLKEYRSLIASSQPVGKRLDFLCQEINREINTIGSKSQLVDVNLRVVDMKACLENIREQIRNIE
ncbi:YicC/YloC family endoribonuclease [Parasphaerochaeta coccoides]|uniref:YicC-like domain-containing protein n=1 Tax=Parasphaerochaeta coccoides (strain ATCC BAA-1237 / DSM 17374 / SPN1) TaxID=760011 RepID=F4GIJ7_PARC1|nr:YicC/YloC family endoribonuclease [Parasphaerochaeta coccoides]AEC02131.1 Conserved hypothetical protein CHP00255 [Parasphaerochaeta coccoides DSM 17374]